MTAESRITGGYVWLGVHGCKQGDAVGRQRDRVGARGEYEGFDIGRFETA
jgi:hypothetical protein